MSIPAARVLCPTDLSSIGDRAVAAAYRLASPGGVVHLLHVHEFAVLPSPLDGTIVQAYVPGDAALSTAQRTAKEHLTRLIPPTAVADGIRTEIHAKGDPSVSGTILAAARECDAGLIVMGTRGRTPLGRLFLGSVAMEVLRNAKVPVMLVHEPGT